MTYCQYTLENKPLVPNELKAYRWITLKEQNEFVKFLETLGGLTKELLHDDKLNWCASEFEKYKCTKDANHSRVTRYLACGNRGHCPRCSMAYAHKRASIMYEWIKTNLADKLSFDLKINQIVLTLPDKLHDIDSKMFVRMIKFFMSVFRIEAYGYCIQNRHSKNPLSEKYLHAHILSLNIRQVENGLVQNDYYFDVDKMRWVWKSIIKKFTGYDFDGNVNLHTEYASILNAKDAVLHILAYLYRYPIQDLFQVQIRDKSINYLEGLQIECTDHTKHTLQLELSSKVFELAQEAKPRLVWCGLLSSRSRELLLKLIGVSKSLWKNLVDVEKELDSRSKFCRDCGSPLEIVPYDRGKYEGDNEPAF